MGSAGLLLLLVISLSGCTHRYFHEGPAGDRYYQTASGEIIRVGRSGFVWKDSEHLGVVRKDPGESDWNLHGYDVVEPSGHCISALSEEIQPTPCWALLWQVPLQFLAAPFVAMQDALGERTISSVGPLPSHAPTHHEQQDHNP